MSGSSSAAEDPRRTAHWREMERAYGESPIHRVLGLSLHVVGPGEVVVAFDGTPDAGNRSGATAGGALAAMVDSACVQAARTLAEPGEHLTTVEMKVNFLHLARPGVPLSTRGTVEQMGRTLAVGSARVTGPDGTLIALGVATARRRRG